MKQAWNDYNPGEFYDELMYTQHQPHPFSYKQTYELSAIDEKRGICTSHKGI